MNKRFIPKNLQIQFCLVLLLALICSVGFVNAQNFWQQLPIYGGGAQNLVIGQQNKIYAYTDINNTLSMSTNAGDNWTKMNIPVDPYSHFHLQACGVSADGSILAIWKDSDKNNALTIYKSQDDGATWQKADTLAGTGSPANLVTGAGNSIFFLYSPFNSQSYPLRRSLDNGATWTTIVPDSQTFFFSSVSANSNGRVVTISYDKILLSTNNGDNWSDISANFPGYGVNLAALNDSNHIFIATYENQIIRSRNNGETWENVFQDTTGGTFQQIEFNQNGDLFASVLFYNQGIPEYRLLRIVTDTGDSETIFSTGQYTDLFMTRFEVASNGTIFMATMNSIYRSTDNGQSWSEITQGLTHYLTNAFAAAASGEIFLSASGLPLLKSTDSGQQWQKAAANYSALDWMRGVKIHNAGIYALSDSGLYKSSDNGATWTTLTTNILDVNCITWDNNARAYIVSSDNNLYRSTINEQTWEPISTSGFSTANVNEIIAAPSGNLFIAADSLGVFRSADQGNSWTSANTGIPLEMAYTFAVDSAGGLLVSVFHDSTEGPYYGGIYRSTDNGVSWQSINNGLPGTVITSIIVNSVGHIYAANLYDGVYRSIDNGQSWAAINSGLPAGTGMWRLGMDSNGYLFAAAVNGIFRSEKSTITPEIVVDVPHEPETGKDLTVTVNKDPNFHPTFIRLFYRGPGETEWHFIESTAEGDSFAFVIPADSISYQGLEYYVYLFDGETVVTYPPENPDTNPISLQVRVTNQVAKLTLSPSSYHMVSVPLLLDNPEIGSVLTDDYGEPDAKNWRLLRWVSLGDSGLYLEYPYLQDTFSPGNAFWLITRDGKTFDVDSAWSNNVNEPFPYVLKPGWNQIGNPFPFPVPADSVRNTGTTGSPVYYDGTQYQYNQTVLQPWEGYFVYNASAQEVTVYVPPIHAQTTLPKIQDRWQAASDKGFSVRLKAQMRNTKLLDTENYFGFSELAEDERDEFDQAEAPPIGEFLQVYDLENGKKFTSNFKSIPEQGQQWNVRLELSDWINFPVDFSIERFGNLPDGFHVYIFDKNDMRTFDISDGKFSLNLPRNVRTRDLKLIIGTEKYASTHSEDIPLQPMNYQLMQNFPNPFNGGTTISYQLAKKSRVKLEIYNVLGRKIRTLVDETQPTGNHKISWDAMDGLRRPVSTGVYFYRIEADKFIATKKLLLIR